MNKTQQPSDMIGCESKRKLEPIDEQLINLYKPKLILEKFDATESCLKNLLTDNSFKGKKSKLQKKMVELFEKDSETEKKKYSKGAKCLVKANERSTAKTRCSSKKKLKRVN